MNTYSASRPGRPKVRDAGRHGDAGAAEDDDRPRRAGGESLREAGDVEGRQLRRPRRRVAHLIPSRQQRLTQLRHHRRLPLLRLIAAPLAAPIVAAALAVTVALLAALLAAF